ncbi:ribose-5-phosphate isomerase RpiA [Caballeronia sp. GAWG1-1]|uniref:ribose-5-phosphate isomerase RpiA n=1 Tax=Caballeronia sp. GAWG1-1 TaxID=2921742 RepID=UPI002027DB8C|nr:ribose-5-phosphate isomerase RpiA [Caballeronia sp. GAWG1-1]
MATYIEPGYAQLKPASKQDEAKLVSGNKAVDHYLKPGMKVGLGSGTTSHWFVRALAPRVKDGLDIVGVPTSNATRELALELGVPLTDLGQIDRLDVTIDGADEIDHQGSMIKGGGACLLWEKIVAAASRKMVAVVDDKKVFDTLGRFPLPIEIIQFGWQSTERLLRDLFVSAGFDESVRIERRVKNGELVVTDSGNWILDCHLQAIPEPLALSPRFNAIPGVVEHGLFTGIASEMIVGHADGTADIVVFEGART